MSYHSLADVRGRKEQLKRDIRDDEEHITALWKQLTRPSEAFERGATPTQRIMGILNMGGGLIDGAILGWKLYRKFKR